MAKYIIKLYDPLYKDFAYCVKGVLIPMGHHGWFYEDSVFDSKNVAKRHIQKMLHQKPRWLRKDIRYANFEIIQLIEHRMFDHSCYYTPDEWEKWKDMLLPMKKYTQGG